MKNKKKKWRYIIIASCIILVLLNSYLKERREKELARGHWSFKGTILSYEQTEDGLTFTIDDIRYLEPCTMILKEDTIFGPHELEERLKNYETGIYVEIESDYYIKDFNNIYPVTLIATDDKTEKEVLPPSDVNLIDQEKVEWFEISYFNVSDNRIVNMFLNSEYETPAEINLNRLFYNGTYSVDAQNASQEELSLLETRYSAMTDLDTSKIMTEDINEILQKYMGITLEETNKQGIEYLHYLEEYDAYYTCVGDTEYTKYDILHGWMNDDGTITLQYMHDQNLSYDKTVYRVTLKEENGNYYFISNVKE